MFRPLTTRARRRPASPGTLVLSVAAHLLVFGGAALASMGEDAAPPPPQPVIPDTLWTEIGPPSPPRVDPIPPASTDDAVPTPGETLELIAPTVVPDGISDPDPALPTIELKDVTGVGPIGDEIGDPPGVRVPPTGVRSGGGGDGPVSAAVLEERPALRNAGEIEALLERVYPDRLRRAGVTGETRLQFVVGTDGRVEPESVVVVASSHPAFDEPAIRAVRRMRFAPASVMGRPVRVIIDLPVRWTIPD